MDDSDGGTGMLGEEIYDLWLELLDEVDSQQKEEMFQWFTKHLNGSVADYLEEYIEQIILEGFKEKEYEQQKILFVQKMIKKSEAEKSEWSQSYNVGKWVLRYLELLEEKKVSQEKIEDVCRQYWTNSAVRKYYINRCIENKEYKQAIAVLNESISLDKMYRGLILDYVEQKKKLYLLLGDKEAYLNELWKLVLEYKPGDLEIYRELKKQYTEEDWLLKREELFQKISGRANVARLYEEEKLYDRLMDYVMNSQGMSLLQEYSNVLKEDFPEQILQKYKYEVNRMALHTGDRKKYQQLVGILRRMKKIKGGTQIVEEIAAEWKVTYRNRPAMMDELSKL